MTSTVLAGLRPDDIDVMDNLGSHKGRGFRELLREASARVWFMPPCGLDLNPIKQVPASSSIFSARPRNARASTHGTGSANCAPNSGYRFNPK